MVDRDRRSQRGGPGYVPPVIHTVVRQVPVIVTAPAPVPSPPPIPIYSSPPEPGPLQGPEANAPAVIPAPAPAPVVIPSSVPALTTCPQRGICNAISEHGPLAAQNFPHPDGLPGRPAKLGSVP